MTTLLLRMRAGWDRLAVDGAGLAIGVILAGTAVLAPGQAGDSIAFTLASLAQTAPWLLASIVIAAWTRASGADGLVARVFAGQPVRMIAIAAVFGALSPFCSCGVIPLIAALLGMGVPLAPVMAFWLASPVIDPSMFVLTAGVLGPEFAVAKTLAAAGLGLGGGFATLLIVRSGRLERPLRPGVGGGCGAPPAPGSERITWAFWRDAARRARFAREARETTLFLGKWLLLAFLLESLMLAYVPAEAITATLGGGGMVPVVAATLVGVPAYLNGYAALPLVSGLIEQGMSPGAGLTFLVAGGVTSIPAAIAVFALVRPRVFALYLAFALGGSLAAGLLYQQWLTLGG